MELCLFSFGLLALAGVLVVAKWIFWAALVRWVLRPRQPTIVIERRPRRRYPHHRKSQEELDQDDDSRFHR